MPLAIVILLFKIPSNCIYIVCGYFNNKKYCCCLKLFFFSFKLPFHNLAFICYFILIYYHLHILYESAVCVDVFFFVWVQCLYIACSVWCNINLSLEGICTRWSKYEHYNNNNKQILVCIIHIDHQLCAMYIRRCVVWVCCGIYLLCEYK